jgi:predicted membrane channel-forming protein YqfA (hemolysin III family)
VSVFYILMGCIPIAVYWLIAYKATTHQRRELASWFFTIVVLIAVAGILYEVLTTGAFSAVSFD